MPASAIAWPLHGTAADRLDIQLTDNEKPYLASEPRLEFNVSHSRELIAIALAWGQSVGVDVEEIDDKRDWPLNRAASVSRGRTELVGLAAG